MFEGFFYQLPQLEAEKVYVFGVCDSDQVSEEDFETLKPLLSEDELLEAAAIFALPARRVALLAYALRRYVLCYYLGKEPHQLEFVTAENGRTTLKGNRLFQFDLMKEGEAVFALALNALVGICTEKHAMTSKPKALTRTAALRAFGNNERSKAHRRQVSWEDKTPDKLKDNEHSGVANTWSGEVFWQAEDITGHKSSLGVVVLTDKPRELDVLLCLPERIIESLPIENAEMSQRFYRYVAQD